MGWSLRTGLVAFTGFATLAVGMGVGRFAFTPLLAQMQAEGRIDVSGGAVVTTVHFLGYLVGALSAVRVAVAPQALIPAALVGVGIATFAMGSVDSLVVWSLLRFVCGVASAWLLVSVSTHLVRDLPRAGSGIGSGFVYAGVGAGIAAVGLLSIVCMTSGVDSIRTWWIAGLGSLLVAVASAVVLGRPSCVAASADPARGYGRTAINWRWLYAYGMAGFGYIVPATYLPLMARGSVPDPAVFGWVWPVFGVMAMVSTILAPRLAGRLGLRRTWMLCQSLLALGIGAPALMTGLAPLIAAAACVGGTFMIITMLGMQSVLGAVPAGDASRHVGLMTAAFAAGQIAGPVVAGWVHHSTGGFWAVLVVTALGTGSGVLALTARTAPGARAARASG